MKNWLQNKELEKNSIMKKCISDALNWHINLSSPMETYSLLMKFGPIGSQLADLVDGCGLFVSINYIALSIQYFKLAFKTLFHIFKA